MRIYQSCIDAADELKRELKEMGIEYQSATVQDKQVGDNPDFRTLELMGYSYCIQQYDDLEKFIDHMGINRQWVEAECEERLDLNYATRPTRLNPGTAWELNKEFWGQFIRNGCFSYSYPERWQAQIQYVIHELKERPNTRQAMMTMYESAKDMMNWGGNDRVPCSLSYQFMIRGNKLHLIYNQRSCDFFLFYGSDVYLTIQLLRYVSNCIGVEPGWFYHNIGSLHVFAGQVKDEF